MRITLDLTAREAAAIFSRNFRIEDYDWCLHEDTDEGYIEIIEAGNSAGTVARFANMDDARLATAMYRAFQRCLLEGEG